MPSLTTEYIEAAIASLAILVIDDSAHIRKVVRNLLLNIGVKTVYEAGDGLTGIDAIRTMSPDVVLLDWEMPMLSGAELVRIVRSPGVFPRPAVPIIILSGFAEHWRVIESARIGANEYLVKPVSANALRDRLTAVIAKPRPMVQIGTYYGPKPRTRLVDRPIEPPPAAPSVVTALI
jgi:two-component system chemotaxis response regulator CheY